MELVILTYVLTTFFGYYIGTDICNYINFTSNFQDIKRKLNNLDEIKSQLNRIETNINCINKS